MNRIDDVPNQKVTERRKLISLYILIDFAEIGTVNAHSLRPVEPTAFVFEITFICDAFKKFKFPTMKRLVIRQ